MTNEATIITCLIYTSYNIESIFSRDETMNYNKYGSNGFYNYGHTTPFMSTVDASMTVERPQTADIFIYPQNLSNALALIQQAPGEQFIQPESYCAGLSRALLGEQNAVQRYRKILYAMQDRVHINMMTEIITDEIRHGILYNYLYTKNGCTG